MVRVSIESKMEGSSIILVVFIARFLIDLFKCSFVLRSLCRLLVSFGQRVLGEEDLDVYYPLWLKVLDLLNSVYLAWLLLKKCYRMF